MFEVVHRIKTTAIDSLIEAFGGEENLIRMAFKHSYFICPDRVRAESPYFPERARYSKTHYLKKGKGERAVWSGDGKKVTTVTLDDNYYAQQAWKRYTGTPLLRKSAYGVRHIWGHPWDPDAYTAGWNLCYMPFWAGMLTEKQHPVPQLQAAVRQASWNLYFADNLVCRKPNFVKNPQFPLDEMLQGQSILILSGSRKVTPRTEKAQTRLGLEESLEKIKSERHQSWKNLHKAVCSLQGKPHKPFSTKNVESTSKSTIRRILKTANIPCTQENLAKLEQLIKQRLT